jgi:hypothetical protein
MTKRYDTRRGAVVEVTGPRRGAPFPSAGTPRFATVSGADLTPAESSAWALAVAHPGVKVRVAAGSDDVGVAGGLVGLITAIGARPTP